MTALSVTATQVAWVSGPITEGAVAGEAFDEGASLYFKASDGKWWKAQCDNTAAEAGQDGLGIALFSASAAGGRGSVAREGAIVTLGAGAAPAAGTVYHPGTTAGTLIPSADLATTNKVSIAALGIGSNQVLVQETYNAGAVVP